MSSSRKTWLSICKSYNTQYWQLQSKSFDKDSMIMVSALSTRVLFFIYTTQFCRGVLGVGKLWLIPLYTQKTSSFAFSNSDPWLDLIPEFKLLRLVWIILKKYHQHINYLIIQLEKHSSRESWVFIHDHQDVRLSTLFLDYHMPTQIHMY